MRSSNFKGCRSDALHKVESPRNGAWTACAKGASTTYDRDLWPAADTDSFDITQLLCRPSKLERIDPTMDYCDRGASRVDHSLDSRASAA